MKSLMVKLAIDGKTIRGSFDKGKERSNPYGECILERKWCCTGAGENGSQSNEITAIPELLNLLYLKKI